MYKGKYRATGLQSLLCTSSLWNTVATTLSQLQYMYISLLYRHTCTHAHTRTHARAHTHTHTHTHTLQHQGFTDTNTQTGRQTDRQTDRQTHHHLMETAWLTSLVMKNSTSFFSCNAFISLSDFLLPVNNRLWYSYCRHGGLIMTEQDGIPWLLSKCLAYIFI